MDFLVCTACSTKATFGPLKQSCWSFCLLRVFDFLPFPWNKIAFIKYEISGWAHRDSRLKPSDQEKKEGEMKWQFVGVSCLSPREKRTGRVGAHPDTGIIAPWLMGAGAFGIINFIYCVLSLSFSPSLSLYLARSLLLCPLPPSSVVAFPRRDDILLIAL